MEFTGEEGAHNTKKWEQSRAGSKVWESNLGQAGGCFVDPDDVKSQGGFLGAGTYLQVQFARGSSIHPGPGRKFYLRHHVEATLLLLLHDINPVR